MWALLWWLIFLIDMLVPRFVSDYACLEEDEDYNLIFRWNVVMDEDKYENNVLIKSLNIFGLGFFPTIYDIIYEEDVSE